jgi:hypothetical protein
MVTIMDQAAAALPVGMQLQALQAATAPQASSSSPSSAPSARRAAQIHYRRSKSSPLALVPTPRLPDVGTSK